MVPHFPRPVAFAMRLSRSLWAKTRLDGLPLIAGMLSRRFVSTIHRGCCDKTPDFHGLCQTKWIPWAVDRWAGAQRPTADRRLRLLVEFLCPNSTAVWLPIIIGLTLPGTCTIINNMADNSDSPLIRAAFTILGGAVSGFIGLYAASRKRVRDAKDTFAVFMSQKLAQIPRRDLAGCGCSRSLAGE